MPFTAEQFFDAFSRYNEGAWPVHLMLILAAVVAAVTAFLYPRRSGLVMATLVMLWVWMATAYHLLVFAALTPVGFAFAALFFVEAMIIGRHAFLTGRLTLETNPGVAARMTGLAFVLYALAGYPLIAVLLGQRYPEFPTFGLPCPTTIFTFGILMWCVRPVPWSVLVVPALWSVIATSSAIEFGIGEDFALLPVALVVVMIRLWSRGPRALPVARTT